MALERLWARSGPGLDQMLSRTDRLHARTGQDFRQLFEGILPVVG